MCSVSIKALKHCQRILFTHIDDDKTKQEKKPFVKTNLNNELFLFRLRPMFELYFEISL